MLLPVKSIPLYDDAEDGDDDGDLKLDDNVNADLDECVNGNVEANEDICTKGDNDADKSTKDFAMSRYQYRTSHAKYYKLTQDRRTTE